MIIAGFNNGLGVMPIAAMQIAPGTTALPVRTSGAVQMTFAQIAAYTKSQLPIIAERQRVNSAAITSVLPPCPAESRMTQNGQSWCYDGLVSAQSLEGPLPPGTFEMYGVAFSVGELVNGGQFTRSYTPSPDQRFWAERAIVNRSQDVIGQAFADAGLRLLQSGNATEAGKISHYSVQQMMGLVPDLRISLGNFALAPIQPTNAEMTGVDGYQNWIARGGFPLSWNVAHGRISSFKDAIDLSVCASILCNCPDANGVPRPACIQGHIGPNGLETGVSTISNNWSPYIGIDEVAPYQFHLVIKHNDPAWYEKVGVFLADQLQKLAQLFCDNKGAVKAQTQATVVEKCADRSGKPCKKGTVGCSCVSPNPVAQESVNVFNAYASSWCAGWEAENALPNWLAPTPGTPSTPPVVPLAKSKYPSGSITAFDPKIQRYRIAIPVGTQLQLGMGSALGSTSSHFEVEQLETSPSSDVAVVSLTQYQRQTNTLPLYKNPLFWTAIGVGAVAIGGGGYVLYRRRRSLTR